MFHVHSSFISNMKNIKDNISPKQMSVVNTEFSLIDRVFSIGIHRNCNTKRYFF